MTLSTPSTDSGPSTTAASQSYGAEPPSEPSPVTVIGLDCGPGSAEGLSERGRQALAEAVLVCGGEPQLAALDALIASGARRTALSGELHTALAALDTAEGPAVVVASGDPGFFGIVRALRSHLDRPDDRLRVLPAVCSVAALFAQAATSWDDAVVVSAHGRDPTAAVNTARRFPKVAVLTGPELGPSELADELGALRRRWVIGEHLGTAQARVATGGPELASQSWADPNVVALIDDDAPTPAKGWAHPGRHTATSWATGEQGFAHRDGIITKAEVRAVVLGWLGPGVGDLVWDIGAGSGSVGVTAATLGAAVLAVEPDPEQAQRVRANAETHSVPVEIVEGAAPAALASAPDPDAVFIGGGGDDLPAIAAEAAARARRTVVAAMATMERLGAVETELSGLGLEPQATMVQACRVAPLGSGHRLAALNPVFVVGGWRT